MAARFRLNQPCCRVSKNRNRTDRSDTRKDVRAFLGTIALDLADKLATGLAIGETH
jgi:hypothetical protein